MGTRYRGTYLISWAQSEIDGVAGAGPAAVSVGSLWRWRGEAVRVDDPRDILLLENPDDMAALHRRAAGQIRRLLGDPALFAAREDETDADEPLFRSSFELTDGRRVFQATLLTLETGHRPMVLFVGALPPRDCDLWVVSCSLGAEFTAPVGEAPGTICFVPGTRITTPEGARPVEVLAEGDRVCTRDNGVQTLRWIGSRTITGGRLMAMTHLRPVRIAAHVLGPDMPDGELVVSPDHRILVRGDAARALFNTPEVLVAARDLVNDRTIRLDRRCRSLRYIHLMLDSHQIVWANGIEVESFHPAGTSPDQIAPDQRAALFERFPDVGADALAYGEFARRRLNRAEAAILAHAGLGGH